MAQYAFDFESPDPKVRGYISVYPSGVKGHVGITLGPIDENITALDANEARRLAKVLHFFSHHGRLPVDDEECKRY